MKRIRQVIMLLLLLYVNSCTVNKYPVNYIIYKGDNKINYPNEIIKISLLNDTSGFFKNYISSEEIFVQKFNYEISNNSFILISNIDTLSKNIISLNNNDTITIYKNKMLYFYDGREKYLLYFRKKFFRH